MTAEAAGGLLASATAPCQGQGLLALSILVFGAVPDHTRSAMVTAVEPSRAPRVQLDGRFGVGLIAAGTWEQVPVTQRRLLVHNLVAHLVPGSPVWIEVGEATRPEVIGHALACGLAPEEEGEALLLFRRTSRRTVHDLVAEARAQLRRTTPEALAARLVDDPGCVVLDTRTQSDRKRFGAVPGSIHVPRTTLEWRVDPSSGYSHPKIHSLEQCLVVMCSEGYSSSLAAVSLQRIGFVNATDLVGGFLAWRNAGLPVERPDREAASRAVSR